MNGDQIGATCFLALVIYTWGVLNRGWTSPVDIGVDIDCRWGGHRWCGHEDAWSEDQDDEEQDTDPPMSTPAPDPVPQPAPRPPNGPLHPPGPYVGQHGPISLDQLAAHVRYAHDPTDTSRQRGESGLAWTRRILEAGLLSPGEIDEIGAEKLGVTPRTVRRWRSLVEGPAAQRDAKATKEPQQ